MCTWHPEISRCLIVQQPDPNQPKPEGDQMAVLKGEPLSVGTNGPLSLLAALQLWGTTQPKAPCLTALDTAGKATCTLTYGKYQQKASCLRSTLYCPVCHVMPPIYLTLFSECHSRHAAWCTLQSRKLQPHGRLCFHLSLFLRQGHTM